MLGLSGQMEGMCQSPKQWESPEGEICSAPPPLFDFSGWAVICFLLFYLLLLSGAFWLQRRTACINWPRVRHRIAAASQCVCVTGGWSLTEGWLHSTFTRLFYYLLVDRTSQGTSGAEVWLRENDSALIRLWRQPSWSPLAAAALWCPLINASLVAVAEPRRCAKTRHDF